MLETLDPDGDRILRARGGSSAISDYPEPVYEYSPRTRR